MFTGIIETVGQVAKVLKSPAGDLKLTINAKGLDLENTRLGDSIAVNGVCLTAVEIGSDWFTADVSFETLEHTRLEQIRTGEPVNLELALTLASRLGGHLVSGHVDGVGRVDRIEASGRSTRYWIQAPEALQKYIAHKGSITVDGVSLTVNALEAQSFCLNIVPHTIQQTIISSYRVGSMVHLEVDLVARYLERLLTPAGSTEQAQPGLTLESLARAGFLHRT
ncbi:riboflavin synthase [Gynuella sp.]|uniref:riboflavin synthase n=1 Tax=Gynuella sp. TaxID=2969146 RepID=UPI003D0B3474